MREQSSRYREDSRHLTPTTLNLFLTVRRWLPCPGHCWAGAALEERGEHLCPSKKGHPCIAEDKPCDGRLLVRLFSVHGMILLVGRCVLSLENSTGRNRDHATLRRHFGISCICGDLGLQAIGSNQRMFVFDHSAVRRIT
jgi:hypothetical protein